MWRPQHISPNSEAFPPAAHYCANSGLFIPCVLHLDLIWGKETTEKDKGEIQHREVVKDITIIITIYAEDVTILRSKRPKLDLIGSIM